MAKKSRNYAAGVKSAVGRRCSFGDRHMSGYTELSPA